MGMRPATLIRRCGRAALILPGGLLLLLAAGEARASDPSVGDLRPVHLNLRRFEIPFSVDPYGKAPAEVQLYVSRDGGSKWELVAARSPEDRHFLFEATSDGRYWFATRTVDAAGVGRTVEPARPQLFVAIDTTEPQAELSAELTDDGQVRVRLVCIDAAPDAKTLRLEYSVDQSRQWTPVPDAEIAAEEDAGKLKVDVRFPPPENWHELVFRVLVGDLAGNKTIVTTKVERPRVAAGPVRLATNKAPSAGPTQPPPAAPPAPPVSPAIPPQVSPPQASPWAVPQFAAAAGLVPPQNAPDPRGPVGDHESAEEAASGPELTAPLVGDSSATDLQRGSGAYSVSPDIPLTPASPPPRPRTAAEAMRPLEPSEPPTTRSVPAASASPSPQPGPTPAPPPGTVPQSTRPPAADATPPSMRPSDSNPAPSEPAYDASSPLHQSGVPVRYSRSRQFSLEYEIESTGLAGVSDIELWGTTDRGRTWKRWGADPDRQSPFDIETNNDGVYGFRIVVVARNGLATPRPLDGEPADIYVVVDTEPPAARITGATYGSGDQTGSLVIRYQCDDEHFPQRPITLSFSESTAGPWSTIAAGLENDGVYIWPADPHLPRQIYLRIDATDAAGNNSHYVLDVPIDIQGLAPRARIRGFNPLTGSAGGKRTDLHADAGPPETAPGETPQESSEPKQSTAGPAGRFR